jgi:hypothetical protein
MPVIKIMIEPRWTRDIHEGEIDITERELAGKSPEQREAYIHKQAEMYVSEECPWGWRIDDEGDGPA